MSPKPFAKKLRSLENAVHEYQKAKPEQTEKKESLLKKITFLFKELKHQVNARRLRIALGALATFFGLGVQTANAQSFKTPVIHPFGLDSTAQFGLITHGDLDNDGDLDLFVGEYLGVLKYFENTGTSTSPNFAAPLVYPFGLDSIYGLSDPLLVDLDNDGDLDLMVGYTDFNGYSIMGEFLYYENIGTKTAPQFAAPQSNPFGLSSTVYINFLSAVDIDNDGDLDILSSEYYGTMKYFQNIGTANNPLFTTPQTNPFGLNPDSSAYFLTPTFGDLDQDGDMDLLAGSYYYGFDYFENTGSAASPSFAAHQDNPFGLTSIGYANFIDLADLDNDGDLDVLANSYYGNFYFYENTAISVSIPEESILIKLYPNPAINYLRIKSNTPFDQVNFYDLSGKLVLSTTFQETISLDQLAQGLYQIELKSKQHRVVERITVER